MCNIHNIRIYRQPILPSINADLVFCRLNKLPKQPLNAVL